MAEVGDLAPTVSLKITTKEEVNANYDLQVAYSDGTAILYFFPATFTGVCTQSSCELRDNLDKFTEKNAKIFGVSVDMPFVHKKFIIDHELNYPLLSDWNKNAINAFNIVDDDFAGGLQGVAQKSLFAIKEGKIIFKWIAEHPGNYPPFDQLKEIL